MLRLCDRLVELHLRGGLPIAATGTAAGLLDRYWLGREERLAEEQRRELYARALGPGFEHLLGLLAAALAAHHDAVGDDDVAWAAAELRSDIAAHADEQARVAAALLHAQLADALALLADRELLSTYGCSDTWQLVDHLSRLEGGGPRDVVRPQALAGAGAAILGWLAAEDDRDVGEELVDAAEAWITAAAMPPS